MKLLATLLLTAAVVGCPPAEKDPDDVNNNTYTTPTPTPSYTPTYTPRPNTTYTNPTQTNPNNTTNNYTNNNGSNYGGYYGGNNGYVGHREGSKRRGVGKVLQGIIDIIFSSKKDRKRDRHRDPVARRTSHPKRYPSTHPSRYPSERSTRRPKTYPSRYPSERSTRRPPRTHPSRYPSERSTRRPPKTHPTHYPSTRPTHYPKRRPSPTPTPFPSSSTTPIVKEVGELFTISVSNYHNYVSLRAQDKNKRNVYILSRVEGKLSHGDSDGWRRRHTKKFDGLFFTEPMDEVYLVAQKHHDRVRALFSVVPSSMVWEVLHDDVSVTLEVEGMTNTQQQEDVYVSLHLQTLYGSELELEDTRRKRRRMTVTNGSGITSFVIKDKLNFRKGCYRWLVATDTHAFVGERFGKCN